jgi:hypothetical protein
MLSQEQIGSYHNAGFTIVKCLLRVEEAKEWKATLRKLVQDDMQKNNPDLWRLGSEYGSVISWTPYLKSIVRNLNL